MKRKWIYLALLLGVFVTVRAAQFSIEDSASEIVAWINETGSLNITEDFICLNCINPEDVNDIDDADIESDLNTYVDIAGDAMTGDFTVDIKTFFVDSTSNMVGINTTTPSHALEIIGDLLLKYTATGADMHGMEIIVNASGYGDVKGLDINYYTGAITTAKNEEVILINIDESLATGGDVVGIEILSTEGLADIWGLEAGALVNPILQLSGTFGSMDVGLVKGTDQLSFFTSTTEDALIFVDDNDNITIGDADKFEEIEFLFNISSSQNINPTFEFSDGEGTWDTFVPTDGTNGMENNGIVTWHDDDIPSWATSGGEYLIRITRTRNNIVTKPREDKIQISAVTEYKWDKSGDLYINNLNVSSIDIEEGNITFGSDTNIGTVYNGNWTYNNGSCIRILGPTSVLEIC